MNTEQLLRSNNVERSGSGPHGSTRAMNSSSSSSTSCVCMRSCVTPSQKVKFEVKLEVVGCCPVSYARTLIGCSGRKERQRRRKRRTLIANSKSFDFDRLIRDKGCRLSKLETVVACYYSKHFHRILVTI